MAIKLPVKKSKESKGLNKGNWSELYSFLKVISERQLKLANEDLETISNKVFAVLQVLKSDDHTSREYDVSDPNYIRMTFVNQANKESLGQKLEYSVPKNAAPKLLDLIKEGKGAFKIPEMDELLNTLNYGPVAAPSSKKGDIKIVIHDYVTNMANEVDFSIKSFLGANPTLLNAGKLSTPLIFKVVGNKLNIEAINNIADGPKVKKRFKAIEDNGATLEFDRMLSSQFQKNLRKIDSLMPIFLSEYVRAYYTTKATKISDLTKTVAESKTVSELLDTPFEFEDVKYKIKQLLINSALGMVPETDWDGFFKADGGYIIIKKDGDMVCFHIYNIAQLGEYLFNCTYFDTPSTSPKKFDHAYLFEKNEEQYFKINFQIRFK